MGRSILQLLIAISPAFSAELLSNLQLRDFKDHCQALMCTLSQAVSSETETVSSIEEIRKLLALRPVTSIRLT